MKNYELREDGTMDILVDGKLETRRYTVNASEPGVGLAVCYGVEPELYDHEDVIRDLGGNMQIVTVRPKAVVVSDAEAAMSFEQQRLEGEVFEAVNNLTRHMGCAAFKLPGRINPHIAVYVGEPEQVARLAADPNQRQALVDEPADPR